ncbi:MAG: hypothetical protein JNL32_13615, partial [Candidatus Kapabacteria bacterium]|nr:hypothetical protein [Candidatus Kapabacteria bacterium]
ITNTSVIYSNGRWQPTLNSLSTARAYHALIVSRDAQNHSIVFAIGGYTGTRVSASSLASVEVLQFNASLSQWSWRSIGSLPFTTGDCAAAFDGNDLIVISGGRIQSSVPIHTGIPTALSATIRISSQTIQALSPMATARVNHAVLMMRSSLNVRTVLSANGEQTSIPATEILSGIAWDPRANPPQFQQRNASNFTDRADIARMVGGLNDANQPTNQGEWYDVKSGWRFMPRMQTPRSHAPILHIAGLNDTSSAYLICGGRTTGNVQTPNCEIFEMPGNGSPNGLWAQFNKMTVAAEERTLAINGDNLPLLAAGSQTATELSGCEMYQPFRANNLDFGQQEIGGESLRLKVRVENTWYLPVMFRNMRTTTAEFRLTNARDSIVVPANGVFEIDVRFRPNTIGRRTAVLRMDVGPMTVDIDLTGVGITSTINVLTSSVDFGRRQLNTDSTICFRAIRNDGNDTTLIDSIRIEPHGTFTLLSPVGSIRLAPDSSLVICVRFRPDRRTTFSSAAILHIADRSYPVSVTGVGVRAFISTIPLSPCDTLAIPIGDSLIIPFRVDNPSDLPVTISRITLASTLSNTFRVRSPLPITLQPNSFAIIDVVFTAQRESEEKVTATFVNTGDTACTATRCLLPRNRTVTFNAPGINTLTLCLGDSTTVPIVIENPSGIDTMRIDSIAIRGMNGRILTSTRHLLPPRKSVLIEIQLAPTTPTSTNGIIECRTQNGISTLPFVLNIQPRMEYRIANTEATLAQQFLVRVQRSDAIAGIATSAVRCRYNGSMLTVRAVRNVAGKTYINEQLSSIQRVYGQAILTIAWQSHPLQQDDVFEIECEALRGNDAETEFVIDSERGSPVCSNTTTSSINIEQLCGGRNGFVRTENVVQMLMMPQPASSSVQVQLSSVPEGGCVLNIRNVLGEVVHERRINNTFETIDITQLPSGLHNVELHRNGLLHSSQFLLITR